MIPLVRLAGAASIAFAAAGALAAELVDTRVPSVELLRLPAGDPPLRVDGKLDEPIWQRAPAFEHLLVLEPDTLAEPPYPTRVRFIYSDRGVYIGAEMTQPRATLISRLSSRDTFPVSRDAFSVTLDTSGAGRYGYWFEVGLGDSYSDGTLLPERQYSNEWDGAWRGASHVTKTGWSAELFIPWGVVAMPQAGSARHMAFYMSRKVAYLDQRWGYPALPPTQPKFISALQGIDMYDVTPRQQWALYPYASVTHDQIDGESPTKAGTDVFWRPSSNLQLTATLNPDFGTVESDEIIVNFSATETYFPEKRLFFLEGQEIFVATPRAQPRNRGVGNSGAPLTMLYTRRIGGPTDEFIVAPGTEVEVQELYQLTELQGAAKATGQIGNFRYGVLGAGEDGRRFQTATNGVPETLHQDGRDFGAVRLLYEDSAGGAYRGLGLLSTAVHKPNGDAYAQGLDFHYLSSSAKWKIDGQTFMSDISGEQRGHGGFVDVEYSIRQGVTQRFGIEYLDAHLDLNDLGYMQRNDEIRVRASHTRTASNLTWARENEFDVRGFLQQNSDDEFNGGGIFVADRVTLNDLDRVTVRASYEPKQYDDLDSFGAGSYKVDSRADLSLRYDTDPTAEWAFGVGGGWFREDLQGNSYTLEGQIDWQPSDRFNTSLSLVYFDRDGWLLYQQEENFTTFRAKQWQPQLTVNYFINARQQLSATLQWVGIKAREQDFYLIPQQPGALIPTAKPPGPSDDFSLSQLNLQLRYRWELAPLSDLFVVYTKLAYQVDSLESSDWGSLFNDAYDEPISNVFVVKIRYRFGS